MIDERYYVNVRELMEELPRPTEKEELPVIIIEVGLWSPVTWL